MKTKLTLKNAIVCFMTLLSTLPAMAQSNSGPVKNRKTLTVLNVDSKGLNLDPVQMGSITRIELEKLDSFEVMDAYDALYLLDRNKLNITNCYGKLCLVEVGNVLKSEYMFGGSVELYGDVTVITFRLIDVPNASVVKTQVKEFLNLPKELQSMIGITIREMFGRKNDPEMVKRLTMNFNYANTTNTPDEEVLRSDGPRMGVTAFTGVAADIMSAKRDKGGYDAIPLMFQFGYQFEKQYLNAGNFQALVEFLPVVTGLDQGLFIPSFTLLQGLRNNRHGWEFAFGPTVNVVRKAMGYYDGNGDWYLTSQWKGTDTSGNFTSNPYSITRRTDSRGDIALSTGFVFAFGKTFKSGKLNIPVNAFIVPAKNGLRFGASFGFNARTRK